MRREALLLVALSGLVVGAPAPPTRGAPPPAWAAARMVGEWKAQVPGRSPTPAGLLSLRGAGRGTLSGTFTPSGGRAEPLKGVQVTDERLTFHFTLSTGRKSGKTFVGRFTPTLDADAWTGRISGPGGHLTVDLVRR